MQVQSLSQDDHLEKGMVTHSGILAWGIPWTEKPGGLCSVGLKELDMTEDWNAKVGSQGIPGVIGKFGMV